MKHLYKLAILLALVLAPSGADAANRFWVGGTGTWDATAGSKWAATSGGAGGQTVPGAADAVTFDNGTGGAGVVTVASSIGGTNTVLSITSTAFTGTIDLSANNPDITAASWLSPVGGSPIVKLGSGTLTINGANGFDFTGVNASSVLNTGTINMSGAIAAANAQTFTGAGKSYGALVLSSRTTGTSTSIVGANSFTSVTVNGPLRCLFPVTVTTTISGALTITGTSNGLVVFAGSAEGAFNIATIAVGSASATWTAFRTITLTGVTLAPTNSFDLGANTGFNFTSSAPIVGSGGGGNRLIGG